MKIGEVAELLGTTPRTLRFYEEQGLLVSCRTPGGTRRYSDEDVQRFKAILRLANAGVPISMINELATTRDPSSTGSESSRQMHDLVMGLIDQVQQEIEVLNMLHNDLLFAASKVKGCFKCKNAPTRQACPDCPVNQNLDKSELLNLIWEQKTCSESI
ncbi:MAG: MerR family transcriptional regulator [Gammaproteobacteria bacterium]|nr:MerR family transcriptional regulator [Gammaproteobacteria bacterium]